MSHNEKIRNIAIIAHVDHGKTTLVDQMFKQSGVFRNNQEIKERVLDRMDIEKERGITIAAKNCSITWRGTKINILDTPGHADFGGEVERALMMVDGAVLLVDASEGPLPQTRFVLKKALEKKLTIVVVINKIDRHDARPQEVVDEVYSLFIDLNATDEQIEFPVLYAIGREGIAKHKIEEESTSLTPLLETIIKVIPGPRHSIDEPFQMLVADLSYSDYLGRLAIGRVTNKVTKNVALVCLGKTNESQPLKMTRLQVYDGIAMVEVDDVEPGDILVLSGIENVHIGDTICTREAPKALPRIMVDEPTVFMRFSINTSPLSGKEGTIVQANKIRNRLIKETLNNVSLGFEDTDDAETFLVKGRGELQLAILIEQMRREGFELTAGRPEVINKKVNGQTLEPIEDVYVDCADSFFGVVTEKLSIRKAQLVNLTNHGSGRIQARFNIPSRGLIGYRNEFLTDTRGTGIMNSIFLGYEPYRGDFPSRLSGSIIADRSGKSVAYALFNLEPRGSLFITAGIDVYEGMVIGENNRSSDLAVNPCKGKKLTNMRASGKDDAVTLTPILPMSLERAIEYIKEDELVEVTPKSIRIRKKYLSAQERIRYHRT
ncbi:translational GTPase TypA [Deltaproteobacteria bacterium TL4]